MTVVTQCHVTTIQDNGYKPAVTYASNPLQAPPTAYVALSNGTTFSSLRLMDILGLGVSRGNLRGVRARS